MRKFSVFVSGVGASFIACELTLALWYVREKAKH